MSHEPWTLFWPRMGLTPAFAKPMWPVIMPRLARFITLAVPTVCSVMPSV